MFKLTDEQQQKKDTLESSLREQETKINRLVDELNFVIRGELQSAIEEHNRLLGGVSDLIIEVVSDMDIHIEEQSDEWEDDDEGVSYLDWKSDWDNFDMTPIEKVEEIAGVESVADQLQKLESKPAQ